MTTRQIALLEDIAGALSDAARAAHAVEPPRTTVELRRLRRVEAAAESLVACAGAAAHWTEDEREGLGYLRVALYGTAS